jgi:hypothetical protein
MSIARTLVTAAFVASISVPALALFPDPGMWAIGDEADGKPGRGIQLDRQGGKTLVLTYFGYRQDGSATFMQAAGQLTGGKTFAGELVEFKNGRSLGGPARSGETAKVIGPISVTFNSTTTGTISLPGEPPQKFSRFQFENNLDGLQSRRFEAATAEDKASLDPAEVRLDLQGNTLRMELNRYDARKPCILTGDLIPAGKGFRSEGSVSCGYSTGPTRYRIEDLQVDEYGMLSARLYWYWGNQTNVPQKTSVKITGVCMSKGIIFLAPSVCLPTELGLEDVDRVE